MSRPDDHHEHDSGGAGGTLIILTFIVLLYLKAAGHDINWWIVWLPILATLGYFFVINLFKKD